MTDMDPDALSAVGVEIARRWIAFAMGGAALGGRTLMHPTGRYASSISFRRYGKSRVAIVADEKRAPEAGILETGHGEIDLKEYPSQMDHAVPLHRGDTLGYNRRRGDYQYSGRGYGAPVLDRSPAGRRKNVWAQPKAQGLTGFAYVGGKGGWIIPAMSAFSPAAHLVELMRNGDL